MKQIIDIERWERREHYHFFSSFDEPFFGITAEIECTKAYQKSKKEGFPFFLYYLHCSALSVNQCEPFRLRIEDQKVVLFDKIHVGTTIESTKGNFSFCFLEFNEDFYHFQQASQLKMEEVRKNGGLGLDSDNSRLDLVHYSSLPWIRFTSVTHARNFARHDTIPKITFGKFFEQGNQLRMPVSINAHHGLVDGYHVGEFLTQFQKNLDR